MQYEVGLLKAMKIVNMMKIREEVDYESLCRKLERQIDDLTSDMDRQQKHRDIEKEQMEKKAKAYEASLADAEKKFIVKYEQHQLESSTYQKVLADTTQMYEKKIAELLQRLEDENSYHATLEAQMTEMQQQLSDNQKLL